MVKFGTKEPFLADDGLSTTMQVALLLPSKKSMWRPTQLTDWEEEAEEQVVHNDSTWIPHENAQQLKQYEALLTKMHWNKVKAAQLHTKLKPVFNCFWRNDMEDINKKDLMSTLGDFLKKLKAMSDGKLNPAFLDDKYEADNDEEEFGIIPMTTFPFKNHNSRNIFHIGTGGGIVKPSSGYAFKRIQEHSDQIIHCLKHGLHLSKSYEGLNGRFVLYDKTMLHAMLHNGVAGEDIFTRLFDRKKASEIFKFLDQKTNFFEELGIFTAPPMWPFTKSFFSVISQ